jgi:hypothetical protein
MTGARGLSSFGAAAESARRAGLGGALNALIDATDAVPLQAGTPILRTSNGTLELRRYLRHRGFLEYVSDGMKEESFYQGPLVAAVDSDATFVDAGAHIGVYTLLTCGRERRVLAFEPDPLLETEMNCTWIDEQRRALLPVTQTRRLGRET